MFYFVLDFGAKVAPITNMKNPSTKSDPRLRTSIRFEEEIWKQIDDAREYRAGYVSRNSWILEAVLEKLNREQREKCIFVMQDDA